jgi:hypothetical protein
MQPTVLKTENRSGRKNITTGKWTRESSSSGGGPLCLCAQVDGSSHSVFSFFFTTRRLATSGLSSKNFSFFIFLVISSSSFFLFLDVIKPFVNAITCVYRETS